MDIEVANCLANRPRTNTRWARNITERKDLARVQLLYSANHSRDQLLINFSRLTERHAGHSGKEPATRQGSAVAVPDLLVICYITGRIIAWCNGRFFIVKLLAGSWDSLANWPMGPESCSCRAQTLQNLYRLSQLDRLYNCLTDPLAADVIKLHIKKTEA